MLGRWLELVMVSVLGGSGLFQFDFAGLSSGPVSLVFVMSFIYLAWVLLGCRGFLFLWSYSVCFWVFRVQFCFFRCIVRFHCFRGTLSCVLTWIWFGLRWAWGAWDGIELCMEFLSFAVGFCFFLVVGIVDFFGCGVVIRFVFCFVVGLYFCRV